MYGQDARRSYRGCSSRGARTAPKPRGARRARKVRGRRGAPNPRGARRPRGGPGGRGARDTRTVSFVFVSDHLALDFAATVAWRTTLRHELLAEPRDFARWAAEAGVVDGLDAV